MLVFFFNTSAVLLHTVLNDVLNPVEELSQQDRKERLSEVPCEFNEEWMSSVCSQVCQTWPLVSLTSPCLGILNPLARFLPYASVMRSFTWEVDGAPLASVPSPYAPQCSVYHLNLILQCSMHHLILLNGKGKSGKYHMKKKYHGRDTFKVWWQKWGHLWSRNRKLWKEQRNNLLEIVSTVTLGWGTSQNFSHRQLHGISCAFYRCCLHDCGHEVDDVLNCQTCFKSMKNWWSWLRQNWAEPLAILEPGSSKGWQWNNAWTDLY